MIIIKQVLFLIVILLFISCVDDGVSPKPIPEFATFDWAKQAGGLGVDHASSIVVDSNKNQYITGCFAEYATFGNTALVASQDHYSNFFIVKNDSNNHFIWAKQIRCAANQRSCFMAVDEQNNIYITGMFEKSVSFDDITITASDEMSENVFIAKLTPNGNFVWAKQLSSNWAAYSKAILCKGNNIYITGGFRGKATSGQISLIALDYSDDCFVCKLDTDGNIKWAKQTPSLQKSFGNGITVDNNSSVYVLGTFRDSTAFGSTILTPKGYQDLFVTKLDKDGNFNWVKQIAGSDPYIPLTAAGITVDSKNNIYITGDFAASIVLESLSITASARDAFIFKMNDCGTPLWAKRAGGDNITYPYSISADKSDNIYITGLFRNTVNFGQAVLTSKGLSDIFVSKLDNNGNFIWASQAGGEGEDQAYSLAVGHQSKVYLTGSFEKSAKFGDALLSTQGYNNRNIFITKLSPIIDN